MLRPADIPNAICVLRMALVAPIVCALLTGHFALGLALVVIAGLSDGLDGWLAKRFDWRSRLGGLLDPLADKLLLVSLFITLAWLGLLPWWLAGVVIGRDLVIVTGGVVYSWLVAPVQPEPSRASKFNTLAQLALVIGILAQQALRLPLDAVLTLAGALVLVTSVVSGMDYVIRWSARAAGVADSAAS
jgi:cardiolipin synthase (CMP-forming)